MVGTPVTNVKVISVMGRGRRGGGGTLYKKDF
jgi:hypothetical protein